MSKGTEELSVLINTMAKSLVDRPENASIESIETAESLTFVVRADDADMGKLIGLGGRTARSLRTIMGGAGRRYGVNCVVDIPKVKR